MIKLFPKDKMNWSLLTKVCIQAFIAPKKAIESSLFD